jgi:heat-inducible transcriptional repressor
VDISSRQQFVLKKVVEAYVEQGQPVGSKWLAEQHDVPWGPSTVRAELARLEELGLLHHPHTSAGRVPTDSGYRHYADELLEDRNLPVPATPTLVEPGDARRELDEAMRATSEQLSQVTNLLAIVAAPPIATSTVRRVEVLLLQPQVVMAMVITSTGGVTKRVISYEQPVDAGLVEWSEQFLNEVLRGMDVGARMVNSRINDPSLGPRERAFLHTLAPVFTELDETAEHTLYVEGAGRLLSEDRVQELSQINDLLSMLEQRAALLALLRSAIDQRSVYLRIGRENPTPALHSLSMVAANYGVVRRNLGAVGVLGPVRMDYATAIVSVRQAAAELSRFVGELYDE